MKTWIIQTSSFVTSLQMGFSSSGSNQVFACDDLVCLHLLLPHRYLNLSNFFISFTLPTIFPQTGQSTTSRRKLSFVANNNHACTIEIKAVNISSPKVYIPYWEGKVRSDSEIEKIVKRLWNQWLQMIAKKNGGRTFLYKWIGWWWMMRRVVVLLVHVISSVSMASTSYS